MFYFFLTVILACDDIGFPTNCSLHGICAFDQRLNETRCVCDSGFYGTFCANFSTTAVSALSTNVATFETKTTTTQTVTKKSVGCLDRTKMGKIPCSGHGECLKYEEPGLDGEYYCYCSEKFYGQYCENEYKSKWTAFLLELFIGWLGVGRFYLGYNFAGVVKLIFGIFGCCGASLMFGKHKASGGEMTMCVGFVVVAMVVMFFVSLIWWLADWISILAGTLHDVDGKPLY